jgi:hypothetical protein
LGDFNSRNITWECTSTNNRGQILEGFLDEESLILLNNSEPTRHNVSNGTFSAIDLTITDPYTSTLLEWHVLTSNIRSDHWPIGIQYHNTSHTQPQSTKWNLKNPNWELITDLIEHELINNPMNLNITINQSTINSIVNIFTHTIIETAHKTIGLKILKNARKMVPWWNNECHESIKNYKKALNRYKETKSVTDHIKLKHTKAISRYIVKNTKLSLGKISLPL